MTAAQLARGVNSDTPPAPEKWSLLREKSAGTNPGFTARDANGQTWFLQFDAPEFPGGRAPAPSRSPPSCSGRSATTRSRRSSRTFDPARAEIDPKATIKRPVGARTPFTRDDITRVLERAARNADGTYRASAGRLLPGKVLGAVPLPGHALRRSERSRAARAPPRAARAARVRRVDEPGRLEGRQHARHARRGERPHGREALPAGRRLDIRHGEQPARMGHGLGVLLRRPGDARSRFFTFGFALSPWQTVPYIEYPSIGVFEGDHFDPTTWKPQTPVDRLHGAARRRCVLGGAEGDGVHRRADSRGGAHRRSTAIRQPKRHLAAVLIKRRDAIGRAYLTADQPDRRSAPRRGRRADVRERRGGRRLRRRRRAAYRAAWFRVRQRDRRRRTPIARDAERDHRRWPRPPASAVGAPALRRDRHHRRQRGAPDLAAAGAHVLPPHERTAGSWSAWSGCLTGTPARRARRRRRRTGDDRTAGRRPTDLRADARQRAGSSGCSRRSPTSAAARRRARC